MKKFTALLLHLAFLAVAVLVPISALGNLLGT